MKRVTAFSVAFVFLAGCSGPDLVSVKGIATRGGQPVKQARLTFYPEDGPTSIGDTDAQGRFELALSRDQKGAVRGKHKVTAVLVPRGSEQEMAIAAGKVKLHPDQDLIKEKFGRLETTPLIFEITKAEPNLQVKLD